MTYKKLNNGVEIPAIGFGVYQMSEKEAYASVRQALDVGYRIIDTAAVYQNEKAVGKAIKDSGIERKEIFVTTKVFVQDSGYEKTRTAFYHSLENLGLEYLDLYLIHKPYGDYYGSYRAMEEFYDLKLVRAIGVTSFWSERLADLITHNRIKPQINQIEINVFNQKQSEIEFMEKEGIQAEAWAPFAEAKNNIFNLPDLLTIAKKHNKTTGQVMLRYMIQRNIIPLPKTTHLERMKENIDVFDFSLDEDDMNTIKTLDTKKSVIYDEMDPGIAKSISSIRFDW